MEQIPQAQPQPQPVGINPKFEEAKALTQRLEMAGAELKSQADRLEQLKTDQLLSGTAGLGMQTQQKSEEELKKEAIINFWRGSQIQDVVKKRG